MRGAAVSEEWRKRQWPSGRLHNGVTNDRLPDMLKAKIAVMLPAALVGNSDHHAGRKGIQATS